MTKKDYIIIAKVLEKHAPSRYNEKGEETADYLNYCSLVYDFAEELTKANHKFDLSKFSKLVFGIIQFQK